MNLKTVLSPIKLGPVEVPNRVVRTAHASGLTGLTLSDGFIAYHLERAKGGCGLSILEAASVHPSSKIDQGVFDPAIIAGYQKLTAAVKPYGMKVFQQLWHGGNVYPAYDGGPPWAVSAVPGYTGLVGQPMNGDDLLELQDSFVKCALHCKEGGLDGVELHAGHGYLFMQFLTSFYNDRRDQYGGPLENRMRFLRETLKKVRLAVGSNFAVGVRMSASQAPGGLTEDEAATVLRTLEAEGLIDFLNASWGDYHRNDTMVGSMHNPTGYELPSSSQLTAAVRVPRIVAGRFRTLEEAEQVLRDGTADLVSMVRAQIADPYLVRKTREGHPEQVRPCIACNQGCIGGSIRNGRLGCLTNPTVGFEVSLAEDDLQPSNAPCKVLVVGGGPAGMEAARVAALRGHQVSLAEAGSKLGGMVNIAKQAPWLHTLGDIAYWLEQEVYRLGVDVRLSTYLEANDIRTEKADAVIIATGSAPRLDGFLPTDPGEPVRGVELPHVLSSLDLITNPSRDVGKTALVLDTVGHFEALSTVEYLLTKGVSVTLVTHHFSMSPYVQSTWRDVPALERFYQLGEFEILTRHQLLEIQPKECVVRPKQAGQNQTRTIPADTVVLVTHNLPLRGLYDELRECQANLVIVGDAKSPRDVQAAIAEGHRAARALN